MAQPLPLTAMSELNSQLILGRMPDKVDAGSEREINVFDVGRAAVAPVHIAGMHNIAGLALHNRDMAEPARALHIGHEDDDRRNADRGLLRVVPARFLRA